MWFFPSWIREALSRTAISSILQPIGNQFLRLRMCWNGQQENGSTRRPWWIRKMSSNYDLPIPTTRSSRRLYTRISDSAAIWVSQCGCSGIRRALHWWSFQNWRNQSVGLRHSACHKGFLQESLNFWLCRANENCSGVITSGSRSSVQFSGKQAGPACLCRERFKAPWYTWIPLGNSCAEI